jgi:hypothetical protein
MSKKIFWNGVALLAFILTVIISIAFYKKWKIYYYGRIVDVTITALPNQFVRNGTMKFDFDGKIYAKSVNGSASNYFQVGEKLQMKHLDGDRIFLFLDENPVGWGIFVLLMIFPSGVCCVYYAFKKDPPPVEAFGKRLS